MLSSRIAPMSREEYRLFNEFLSDQFGLHFPEHKKELMESRLSGRLAELSLCRYMDYYMLLQYSGNGEIRRLASLVTNNETYFFRETHQFDALFQFGLDDLKVGTAVPDTLRFLCAGCSSGEEPYSLNIYGKENQYRMWGLGLEIDAFDIDETRLGMARTAEYGRGALRGVEEEKIHRYFTPAEKLDTFSLKQIFRKGVAFHAGNILSYESYARAYPYDALFCRNVLIYFPESQVRAAISNFARCLRKGGLLFLGHSESIIGLSSEFEPVRLGNCIAYRKI